MFRRGKEIAVAGDRIDVGSNTKRRNEIARISIDGPELDLGRARDHVGHLVDLIAVLRG